MGQGLRIGDVIDSNDVLHGLVYKDGSVSADKYIVYEGEADNVIDLTAFPVDPNYRVKEWIGTDDDTITDVVNNNWSNGAYKNKNALDKDRDFLNKGDVFSNEMIDSYLALKWEEVNNFDNTPHPVEFLMYYSS